MVKPIVAIALLAIAGSLGAIPEAKSWGVKRPAKPPAKPACHTGKPKLSPDKASVSLSGWCIINRKRTTADLTYKYSLYDYWGYRCGPVTAGKGNSFPLEYPAYSVQISLTATKKFKGHYLRKVAKVQSVSIGSLKMSCRVRLPTDVPTPASNAFGYVCSYTFKPSSGNTCGVVMGPDGKPLPSSVPVPYWTDHPRVEKNEFYAPPFASPSGLCTEEEDTDVTAQWLGNQLHPGKWVCTDGIYIVPRWYIYLAPDDPHGGVGYHPPPSCRAGNFLVVPPPPNSTPLPFGGTFTHFTLPSNLAGRVDVEVLMLVFRGDGSDTDVLLSSEYADVSAYPNSNGTVNGCPALLAGG
jgi:hypothetical protein